MSPEALQVLSVYSVDGIFFCCRAAHRSSPAPWSCSPASPAQRPAPCVWPRPSHLFISPFFLLFFFISMSQLWKGLEHILMQFCLSVSRLFKLFIFWGIAFTELCSNSNRIIYYDKWHCEIVLFLQIVFFSLCFILCLCLSSPPQQQHCMWLMKGCFENSLSSSVNWPDCQEVGV